jgi:colicin import membrane protein
LDLERQEMDRQRVKGVVDQYSLLIQQRVKRFWIRPANTASGLQCTLRVKLLPGGDVRSVEIVQSSGNPIFDRSAEAAVSKAAPLPQPTDPKALATFKDFQFIFKPE